MTAPDLANDPDVMKVSGMLTKLVKDMLDGKGVVIDPFSIPGVISAGKRMSGKEGSGKEVFHQLLHLVLTEHPEVIDLAFAGLSEVAKNKIRKLLNTPEIKDAERT